jgi:hypothetical protein
MAAAHGQIWSCGHTVLIAEMLLIELPPAEQSFAPGGGIFGLELIAFGLLFLVLGLVLTSSQTWSTQSAPAFRYTHLQVSVVLKAD